MALVSSASTTAPAYPVLGAVDSTHLLFGNCILGSCVGGAGPGTWKSRVARSVPLKLCHLVSILGSCRTCSKFCFDTAKSMSLSRSVSSSFLLPSS